MNDRKELRRRRRSERAYRRSYKRSRFTGLPLKEIVFAALGIGLPVLLVVVGLNERELSRRADPVPAGLAINTSRLSTPVFSLRRVPETVAQPLLTTAMAAQLATVFPRLPENSCMVVEADGVVVGERNPDRVLIPASNMKLIIGAVALEVLGPDYRYRTEVRADLLNDGKTAVDLFIFGSGDPYLSTPRYREASLSYAFYADTPWTLLDDLANQILAYGVESVRGDIYADDSKYDRNDRGSPNWGPGIIGPIGAFVANDSRGQYETENYITGDPALHAASQFKAMLSERGLRPSSPRVMTPELKTEAEAFPVVATAQSAPMSEIVSTMLTRSDNETAELLLREIAVARGKPGNAASGHEVVREVLGSWGVPLDGLNLVDGSGLDRTNGLTCRSLVGLLRRMDVNSVVAQGLPRPGQPGTLRDRLGTSAVKDTLAAKTGALTGIRSLSGIVTARDGHRITFSILLNDLPAGRENRVSDPVFAEAAAAFALFPGAIDVFAFGPSAAIAA